jgi:predicted phosphoribosyltransferase
MSEEMNTVLLRAVLEQYATPDPKIVGTIPRNGINLAYVSHADITRILIEIDPLWSWQPVAWENGRPAIHVDNGTATMWATLPTLSTLLCKKQAQLLELVM